MKNLKGIVLPTCEILVKGQKRKNYGKKKNKIYLNDKDNFQLKIFNPLQEKIGVQLKTNGKNIDNDILVINPGQEIIIDRYIGTNRKLTFSAYEIDITNMSDSKIEKAKKAIEKNGILEIVFWNEKEIKYDTSCLSGNSGTQGASGTIGLSGFASGKTSSDVVINGNLTVTGNIKLSNDNINWINKNEIVYSPPGTSTTEADMSFISSNLTSPNISSDLKAAQKKWAPLYELTSNSGTQRLIITDNGNVGIGTINPDSTFYSNSLKDVIQTGRIEKGEKSNQHFNHINFNVGEVFYKIKYKLLPFSLKPTKKKLYNSLDIKNSINNTYIRNESNIREYCKKCSYRISRGKGNWNNCPMCGKKIK